MASRQAINVGFPNPNYVSETSTRQAILPGVYEAETVIYAVVTNIGIAAEFSVSLITDRTLPSEASGTAATRDLFIPCETISTSVNNSVVIAECSSSLVTDDHISAEWSGSAASLDLFSPIEAASASAIAVVGVPLEWGALLLRDAAAPFETRTVAKRLRPYLMINT